MSELELLVTIRDTSDSAALHFMNFVSGLFAFVLASHFVGARLSRINLAILIALFSAFSLITAFAAFSRLSMAGRLLEQLSTLPDPKLPLSAFAPASYAPTSISIIILLGYVGGVLFLLETRRAARSQSIPPAG
jgi:hypothetical protein